MVAHDSNCPSAAHRHTVGISLLSHNAGLATVTGGRFSGNSKQNVLLHDVSMN